MQGCDIIDTTSSSERLYGMFRFFAPDFIADILKRSFCVNPVLFVWLFVINTPLQYLQDLQFALERALKFFHVVLKIFPQDSHLTSIIYSQHL